MVDYPTRGWLAATRIGYCFRSSAASLAVGLASIAGAIASASDGAPIDATLRNDASLADVFFHDRMSGWAVGDRGVIWHTTDGGITWAQQNSNVACRLNSVFFIDHNRGWIVGGESRPYARATQGVILRTENGGASWVAVPRLMLPLLTRVKFFDEKVGVAIGYAAQFQPSSVFVTRDGGQTWQALPTDQRGCWLASDFLDANTGAVAGSGGRFATIARHQVVHSPLATASLRSFHAMRLIAPAGGWIVGDGGLVMSTSDGGRSWQSTPAELPNNAAEHFDFRALAVHGQQVWIAGTPGTRVFRSQDGGQSWQVFDTGHFAPIRALAFADAQKGWAVGDLGCILTTEDGGSSWRAQREGGRRAAMLAVFASETDVPLELVAQVGAAEGYIATVNIMHGEAERSEPDDVSTNTAAAEGMLLAGAAATNCAWQFPLPAEHLALTPDDLLTALNRSTDGRAIEQLERHLVRQIRMWRPNVVITHHGDRKTSGSWGRALASPQSFDAPGAQQANDSYPAAMLVEQLLLRAVTAAADPAKFLELSSGVGLESWQVNKVYGVLPAGLHGDERIDTSRFSSALRATPADFAAVSRRLLFPRYIAAPDVIELKSLMSKVTETNGPPGIFSGIPLSYRSEARRAAPELAADDIDTLRRLATRRRHLQQLLKRTEGNAAWVGQVANITDGLDASSGGELLMQLAEGYRATGNLDLAADTYYLFARQYPDHPLVDAALMWLVQFYASGEAAHRAASRGLTQVGTNILADGADPPEENQPISPGNESPPSNDGVRQASAETVVPNATPTVGLSLDDRRRRAVQLGEYLRTARPHLYAEPLVRFAEVAAQRQLGYPNEAKRYFLSLRQLPESNAWRRCAASEEWLANPGNIPPPIPLATCRRTTARPHLDGRLDEPFWKTADVLRLRGDERANRPALAVEHGSAGDKTDSATTDDPPPASGEVRLTYDNEFLYLAICCPKFARGEYSPDDRARPRDADLSQHDRVEVQLDFDRDFATTYLLTVDSRGWSCEACWGDRNWNPTWYIAAADEETSWTVEAAMPLAELTANPPAAKHVWAASARRTIPRMGCESWAGTPTGDESPNHFGLLIFE